MPPNQPLQRTRRKRRAAEGDVKQLDHSCACFRSFLPTTGPGLRGKPAGTPIFSSVSARFKRQRTSGSVVPTVASQQTKLSVSPPVDRKSTRLNSSHLVIS